MKIEKILKCFIWCDIIQIDKYPPEKYEDAIETVMSQCEMWTDNTEI